jgi:hypothetical protein
MSLYEQFVMAIHALQEVEEEIGSAPSLPNTPSFPTLDEVLDQIDPVPGASLLFGVADDGLPILLNLNNPRPGPILILGDAGTGKTEFLQVAAAAAMRLHTPDQIQLAVLASQPEDWAKYAGDHLFGIAPIRPREARDLFFRAAGWIQDHDPDQALVLMIDGLDAAARLDSQSQESLSWMLQNGPQSCLWPVVTLNSTLALDLPEWLALFHSRIYGRVENAATSVQLTPIPGAALNTLFPGAQFSMREKTHWLRFWLPLA